MKVFLDGEYVDQKDAKISVFDHGLLYGDGIFEGIRIYDGNIYRLDAHLERLWMSAQALMLRIPMTFQEMSDATCETCRRNGLKDGYIRLLVTRGAGKLGLDPDVCPKASVVIIADKIALYPESYYTDGLAIITAATRRIKPDALSANIKSLNYLNNILAKIEAKNAGCLEAIMLNDEGYVAECTGDNIFAKCKGKWYSPPGYCGALKGITRDAVVEIGERIGLPVREQPMTRYDIWNAEELFLTGTAAELIPVIKVDGRIIGTGKPGPDTARFLAEFRDIARKDGTRI
jgi:branched-chain amino acid aminotransferase